MFNPQVQTCSMLRMSLMLRCNDGSIRLNPRSFPCLFLGWYPSKALDYYRFSILSLFTAKVQGREIESAYKFTYGTSMVNWVKNLVRGKLILTISFIYWLSLSSSMFYIDGYHVELCNSVPTVTHDCHLLAVKTWHQQAKIWPQYLNRYLRKMP